MSHNYYIGWDVGGWNCDRNRRSRDALCVLTGNWDDLKIAGDPWRGNLRGALSDVGRDDILPTILKEIGIELREGDTATWAIDTPLGWPEAFRGLICPTGDTVDVPEHARQNPYLFRKTEMWLVESGFSPLSAVRDMIGSQSTKGIHFLCRCGFTQHSVGIWTSNGQTAIETYPAPVATSKYLGSAFERIQTPLLRQPAARGDHAHKDLKDSLKCALVAALFVLHRQRLHPPAQDIPAEEGWIWIPTDCRRLQAG
jgi:hypothetical protein